MRQANKVAIVTGGAQHRPSYCLRLAKEGAHIAICDVQPNTDTVALIEEHGQAALALKVDITKESQVGSCRRDHGQIG